MMRVPEVYDKCQRNMMISNIGCIQCKVWECMIVSEEYNKCVEGIE